jgi:hypothetical protein
MQAALACLREDADGVVDLIGTSSKTDNKQASAVARLIATSYKFSFVRQLLASFAAQGTLPRYVWYHAVIMLHDNRLEATVDVAIQSIDAHVGCCAACTRTGWPSMWCVRCVVRMSR